MQNFFIVIFINIQAESRGFGSTLDINEYNNKKVLHAAASESDDKLSEIKGNGTVEDIASKLNNVIDTL
jgi:hypothetical protein